MTAKQPSPPTPPKPFDLVTSLETPTRTTIAHDATSAIIIDNYVETLQSQHSRETVEYSLRRLARIVTNGHSSDARAIAWHAIEFKSMNAIRKQLAEQCPPATANLTLSILRQLLKVGFVLGHVTQQQYTAAQAIKNVRGSRERRGKQITTSEETLLQDVVLRLETPAREMWSAVMSVMINAGFRREEICSIRVEDYRDAAITVIGKGNKERSVPLSPGAVATVERWLRVRATLGVKHDRLFAAPRSKRPLQPKWLWGRLKLFVHEAGISRRLAPHDFRRTFASRFLEHGDLGDLQVFMGHASISTTGIYDRRAIEARVDRLRARGDLGGDWIDGDGSVWGRIAALPSMEPPPSIPSKTTRAHVAYVYFARSDTLRLVKIGCTSSVSGRLVSIEQELPTCRPLTLVAAVHVTSSVETNSEDYATHDIERWIHGRLGGGAKNKSAPERKHLPGSEWFEPSQKLLSFIEVARNGFAALYDYLKTSG